MSEPTANAVEWTVAHGNMIYDGSANDGRNFLAIVKDEQERLRIVNAHNAALAAEREKRRIDLEHILDLEHQLDWSQHIRLQLAAEVEKVNKLQDQLAEANQAFSDAVAEGRLRQEQLAAEREKSEPTASAEWTVEQQGTRNLWELRSGTKLITTSTHYSMLQIIADAHNDALANQKVLPPRN